MNRARGERGAEGGPRPAGVVVRATVGALDGALTSSLVLAIAWGAGLLPSLDDLGGLGRDATSLAALVTSARLPGVAAQVGVLVALRIAVIFSFDTLSVALGGQTPGCRLLRVRIVGTDGERVRIGGALKRAAAGGVIAHTPVVGQAMRAADYGAALFGRQRRAVRDRVAGTMLVHVERAPAPDVEAAAVDLAAEPHAA